uniref:Nuclear cap-binding protein subunit 1 n=1 Tax=Phallusia mammillata TaxID=59560 RepID=A0A6F9DML2_9ASCI|nr:nuclear cap-binding protein subunit 1-A-like [Phallusia mammillata]
MPRRPHQKDSDTDEDGRTSASFTKRRKTSETTEEIEKRLESLICRVGEKSSSSLESNLEGLAAVLEADLPNFKPQILQILLCCSYQLPEKCPIYTTLVGLLNVRNYKCGGEFVEMLLLKLKRLLSISQFENARFLIQFVSDLVNCNVIAPASVMSLLDGFVDVTKQEGIPQSRKDWYVYVVMATLPWCGATLTEKKVDEMEVLFTKMQRYIMTRQKPHHDFLRVWAIDEPHPQEEYMDCLFAQICKLREDNWVEDILPRPYKAFEPVLENALQHTFPDFVVPPHIEGTSLYPIPKVIFRIFDYTDCPEGPLLPGNHAIERWLIEESMRNMINTNKYDKKECATRLLNFPGKEKIPLNHMIIECLLGDMFRLPVSPLQQIFYTSIFIELCRLQPGMIPQVLAIASDMLFERLDTMNITCVDRFVNWFSHHLSNFQFRWTWDDWGDCLQEDFNSPKPKFIREVLEKCMRLAFFARIRDIVPQDFEPLVPQPPKICFKYEVVPGANASEDDHMMITSSQKIIAAIKNKCQDDELIVMLEEMFPQGPEQVHNGKRLELFLQSLLFLAQKSFSHSFSALFKFHKVLKWAASDEEGKVDVLRITKDIWRNHPQMLIVLVDRMLRMEIVDCSSVAKWLFSPDMAPDFTRMYVWEIMHMTIRKMNKHVARLDASLVEMQERAIVDDKKMDDDEESDMRRSYSVFAPNEEDIQKMKEQVDTASGEQKKLFLIIFQRFIMILSDHLARSAGLHKNYNTSWYKNTIERLKEIFLLHKDMVKKYMSTMENLLFTVDLDPHILTVFKQFASIAK